MGIGRLDSPGATFPMRVPSSSTIRCVVLSLFFQTIASPTDACMGFGAKALFPDVPTMLTTSATGTRSASGIGTDSGSGIEAGPGSGIESGSGYS